jgi:hypothetical protein
MVKGTTPPPLASAPYERAPSRLTSSCWVANGGLGLLKILKDRTPPIPRLPTTLRYPFHPSTIPLSVIIKLIHYIQDGVGGGRTEAPGGWGVSDHQDVQYGEPPIKAPSGARQERMIISSSLASLMIIFPTRNRIIPSTKIFSTWNENPLTTSF